MKTCLTVEKIRRRGRSCPLESQKMKSTSKRKTSLKLQTLRRKRREDWTTWRLALTT